MSLQMSFRDAPIKRKLMLVGLVTSGLALFYISLIMMVADWVSVRSRMVSDLTTYANVIGTNAAAAVLFDDRKAAAETLSALSAKPDIVHAAIYNASGELFATYLAPGHPTNVMQRPEPGLDLVTLHSMVVARPIMLKGDLLGVVYLEADLHGLYAVILRDIGLISAAAVAAFLMTMVFFSRLQQAIVNPIHDLADAIQAIATEQNYAVRAKVYGKDEIGLLSRAFNGMLDRLQARDAELAQYRDHLEKEVAQRTADLKEANRLLGKLNENLEEKVAERTQQLLAAQEELLRKEKLAVLGQVAGSVGHELRNPLGVMSNAVYFLQTVLSDSDEAVREYLGIIKDEIAGADRIVGDLLDSVRTQPPQVAVVSAAELVGQTLRKCTIPPNVTVHQDIPASLPPLQVDPLQIHQVLRNLVSNGVEAMPDGGMLDIRAVEDVAAGTVAISVRDSGVGMSPEQVGKLFQPLFTTKARGIGLGLVVVKNLTEANGGKVEVQSKPTKGTLFTVTLPAAGEKDVLT